LLIRRKPGCADLLQGHKFVGIDVLSLALGKAIEEHRSIPGPIGDQHAIAGRAALSSPRDPLFDDPAAESGIDEAAFCPCHSFRQVPICYPLAAREPHEPFGFENMHAGPKAANYNTLNYISKLFP
jgi:hypothetical protein